jgi:hypothetical protein
MNNSDSPFSNHPALKNINPLKLRLLQEITQKSKGHSMEEMLPQIMLINKELKKRDLEFTKEETELLMDILMEDLSPADRQRFQMLRSLMT